MRDPITRAMLSARREGLVYSAAGGDLRSSRAHRRSTWAHPRTLSGASNQPHKRAPAAASLSATCAWRTNTSLVGCMLITRCMQPVYPSRASESIADDAFERTSAVYWTDQG